MCAFAPWERATRCTGSATPGAKALMKWSLQNFAEAGNLGIYNCRTVRGGTTTSCHGEGRAVDVGFPGRGNPEGHRLVQTLRPVADRLGIQAIVFDRTIWSAKSPGRKGRSYTGQNPHYDHVHVELTRAGGAQLTLATIRHVVDGGDLPAPPRRPTAGSRVLRTGAQGPDVLQLQRILRLDDADGSFESKTTAAVRAFQEERGLAVDGVVGPSSWAVLLDDPPSADRRAP